ncbi:MAG TPA: YHS domain-containing (seleno)protein [Chitinophagaceae bacterium]|nr:YHS domain-containing (seleno)protein [Chitinophagaceae bacterium]
MKKCTILLPLLAFFAIGALAQDPTATRKKQFNLEDGIGDQGYDPVAYFTENKAVKGSKDNAVVYEGVTWYFSSPANKELFKKNPGKYEPAYGGWCAYAMGAKGEKVSVDPATFKITDGRLYLFYNRFFKNTLPEWNKDEAHLKKNADANWQKTFH